MLRFGIEQLAGKGWVENERLYRIQKCMKMDSNKSLCFREIGM